MRAWPIDQRARRAIWLLVPAFLGIFWLPWAFSTLRGAAIGPAPPAADQAEVVTVAGQPWRRAGAAEALPPDQLRLTGRSREGYPVYLRVAGGGGPGERRLYLRRADGRYQPFQRARE